MEPFEEMEKKPILITTDETVLRPNLLSSVAPRLTPTGKISHAKTRVYTQRYRKEWEQMPDFKGWLTSVQFQPTRAFCTYCKKNLHAHRLSLLKHTCTMKHQRAALQHEAEEKKKEAVLKVEMGEVLEGTDGEEVEALGAVQTELEENDDEIEYVVERLEMDEDELEASQMKSSDEVGVEQEEIEEEEVEEENEVCLRACNEDDIKPMLKKIKMEHTDNPRDTLVEAMAHVHGEYLDEADGQDNIELEMVVESEDQNADEMQVMAVVQDSDDNMKNTLKDSHEMVKVRKLDIKSEKKMGKVLQGDPRTQEDAAMVTTCQLPILGTTYQLNSVTPTSNAIGVLQPVSTIPIAPAQNKTITLTSGGKTLTLTGGTFQPGTQYVLSKVKGKLPTLVVADKKTMITQPENIVKNIQFNKERSPMASTSQQFSKKNVKSAVIRKPRISTHVVDTSKGLPIGGLQVSLYKLMDGRWTFLNESTTSPNGRCVDLADNMKVNFTAGRYKIHFDVDKYFTLRRIETMYPFIEIVFDVKNAAGQYHIPLLLSPFGYTTYRGSER